MWAIWQALQVLRGLPYKAHCALSLTRDTLKPFGFPSPLNNNQKTFSRARGDQVYEYQKNFLYDYDSLTFGGMTIPQLNQFLAERGNRDRTFVGVKLHNIGVSAWVKMHISVPGGMFHVLVESSSLNINLFQPQLPTLSFYYSFIVLILQLSMFICSA